MPKAGNTNAQEIEGALCEVAIVRPVLDGRVFIVAADLPEKTCMRYFVVETETVEAFNLETGCRIFVDEDGEILFRLAEKSGEHDPVEADGEQDGPDCDQRSSNWRETVRIARDDADDAPEGVVLDGLLHLTVPHLSHTEEDEPDREQQRLLVVRSDGGDGNQDARNHKRNGPVAMIANFLRIHRSRSDCFEIVSRFRRDDDGRFTQEMILPAGWRVAKWGRP